MFRTIFAVCLASVLAHAASDCEMAEWVIRWEGRVTLEGVRQPVTDVAQLPAGECRIVGVDLTGAVMVPAELAKLGGLVSLRELYLPGPIWNPGGGNEDGNQVFKALRGSRSWRSCISVGTSTRKSTFGIRGSSTCSG